MRREKKENSPRGKVKKKKKSLRKVNQGSEQRLFVKAKKKTKRKKKTKL